MVRLRFFLFRIVLLTGLSYWNGNELNAKTYYVSVIGNNNNEGTYNQPWATWQKAFDKALAGDTVFIRGGTYYSSGTNTQPTIAPYAYTPHGHSGTKEKPICFFAYPGETPILDCRGQYSNSSIVSGISLISCQFIHFKGLTIRNVYQRQSDKLAQGISIEFTANLTFENMTICNIGGRGVGGECLTGFYDKVTTPITILYDTTRWINCDFYNLCDSISSNPGNAADGIKITLTGRTSTQYAIPYWYLYGCRVWNYSDDGFDIGGPGIVVDDNCWVSSTKKYIQFGIEGNGFKEGGVFIQFVAADADAGFHWRQQKNCIAVYCEGSGFYDLDYEPYYRTNGLVYNNLAYHNKIGYFACANGPKPRTTVYKNNIAYQNSDYPAAIYYTSVYQESNNTWDATQDNTWPGWVPASDVTVSDADFVSLDTTGMWGPRKADGALPNINFGKLTGSSDLINAGVDVGLPFNGSDPDIGYAEFSILVTGLKIESVGGLSTIDINNGTLQLTSTITPTDATNKNVFWSIYNGTGQAKISSTGLVTAIANGTVIAKAAASDGSGVYDQLEITLSNQEFIQITDIVVTGAESSTSITTDNGTLQLTATIAPADASNKTVTWSVQNGTGQASISTLGLVTAIANGTVTARATANDGSGVYETFTIAITNQTVLVTNILVTGEGGATAISADNGTLQLSAVITPEDATIKTVTWSIQNGDAVLATISPSGLLTAIADGQIRVFATATDGSGVSGILDVTITNQGTPTNIDAQEMESVLITLTNTHINIHLDENKRFQNLYLFDIQGRQIINTKLLDSEYTIDSNSLIPGVYIVILSGKEEIKVVKFSFP
jgi:uncharacterized protein YjdB